MARVLVVDSNGRVRATFSDPTGTDKDNWEAPIPQDLDAISQAWPDLAEAIDTVRRDERKD